MALIGIIDVPVKVQTEHLLNTSWKGYCLSQFNGVGKNIFERMERDSVLQLTFCC
jgi:hypothetical protein